MNNELFSANDKNDRIKPLSSTEIKDKQKKRAEKLKQKLGLENVDYQQILDKTSQITDINQQVVKDAEKQTSLTEGNIAEILAKAALSNNDGDINTALNTAKNYHQTTTITEADILAQQQLAVKKIFT